MKISIITATFNAESTIENLLSSLANQTYENFELIIQDNCSSDKTLEILSNYQGKLPNLIINSQKDSGIYEAWNKAIEHITGDWVLFLGADDQLYNDQVLSKVSQKLKLLAPDILYFSAQLELCLPNGQGIEIVKCAIDPYVSLPLGTSIPHSALFHKNELFEHNKFDSNLKIVGDYDFLCRTLQPNNWQGTDIICTKMAVGGISGSLKTMHKSEFEMLKCSKKYFPKGQRFKLYLRLIRSYLYLIINKILGKKYADRFADLVRQAQGKPKLWTR